MWTKITTQTTTESKPNQSKKKKKKKKKSSKNSTNDELDSEQKDVKKKQPPLLDESDVLLANSPKFPTVNEMIEFWKGKSVASSQFSEVRERNFFLLVGLVLHKQLDVFKCNFAVCFLI